MWRSAYNRNLGMLLPFLVSYTVFDLPPTTPKNTHPRQRTSSYFRSGLRPKGGQEWLEIRANRSTKKAQLLSSRCTILNAVSLQSILQCLLMKPSNSWSMCNSCPWHPSTNEHRQKYFSTSAYPN